MRTVKYGAIWPSRLLGGDRADQAARQSDIFDMMN